MSKKLLFNEGGQPVYLDDLLLLQTNMREVTDNLLSALGGDLDQEIFWAKKPTMKVIPSGVQTAYSFSSGAVWHEDFGLIPVAPCSIVPNEGLYVQINSSQSNVREFEDGQQHACMEMYTAQIVANPTGRSYSFNSIMDMMSVLAEKIDEKNKTNYTVVDVEWTNGYSGVVERKKIYGGYRYHVKASSRQGTWDATGKIICFGAFPPAVSTMFMTGGDTGARMSPHYIILSTEGYIILSGDNTWGPSFCEIETTFDVLDETLK